MLTTRRGISLVVLIACTSLRAQSPDAHWDHWRGPQRNGVSASANPPLTWSESENVRWKVPIAGSGTSTPIIWGDRLFLLTAISTVQKDPSIPDPKDQPKTNFFDIKRPNAKHDFVVLCLARGTGNVLWKRVATSKVPHEGTHQDNDFASASPTTDGQRLYCWFGSAGLFCYDLDGSLLWQRDFGEVAVGSSLGEGCSPVVHRGKLVIVRDHSERGAIFVLDCATGQTLWQHAREEANAWATPLIIEDGNTTQLVTAASKRVRSYDLNSGETLWECGGLTGNVTPCPLLADDLVICMSGYQGYSALAIPFAARGDLTDSPQIRWKINERTPYVPSPLLYDGLLYCNQSNQSIWTCRSAATGELVYGPQRLNGITNIYASPVGAQGRIYIVGRAGTTLVISKGKTYEVLATNRLDERFDASPALAGNQLFLRGAKYLYCIEQR